MATTTSNIPRVGRQRWWQKYRNQYILVGFLFVLPALINFAVFRYYPMAWAVNTSLWRYSLLRGFQEFVGIDHYIRAFTADTQFISSMKATLYYVLGKVPLTIILGLALASFANQERRGMGLMRALIFIPVVTSFVVVSIVWGMVLNRDVGLMNATLQGLGLPRMEFLTSPTNVMPTIIGISLWKDVGYSVIILVAGMRGIAQEFYDAAVVDGANAWQRFRYVTVPMLRRHLMFVSVISTLGAFQVFVPVYQLAPQQRNAQVIVYYIYQKGFIFGEMGYASALSVILLLILLFLSIFQIRVLRSEDV
ncbi:MAG: sugar ABC transporter permease [Chloroflexi bacterium]|nr:MAG: sugar ABC transporter permease [Chloroflexota bacterium]MBL1192782.1 sugar ABC transporter permease [Chloroflexota bacterium]NOH10076.1 sugar ABC transporter permease [Chloroflexota bacterium]